MLETLNNRQRDAVRTVDCPLLVLAGAGSGKTRVITYKIAYLIRELQYKARHITAVTFTNKAAREMKSRISLILETKETKGLTVSTFHNLGLTILKKEIKHLGYKETFSIFDDQDCLKLIQGLAGETADKEQLGFIQMQISRWKNAEVSPKQALLLAADTLTEHAAHVYGLYVRQLKAYNAADFDDLIILPVKLFRKHPQILQRWQHKIHYLLVDEYQDTNTSQYQLVKLLMEERGALTVVGDDDQSIYAWRGAQPENLHLLQQDFPRLKVIKLEQNYRSTGYILKAANTLISHNPHIFNKKLWSEKGNGEPLRVIFSKDEFHEAERVVSELISHKFQHRTDFSEYAILYRGNYQAKTFEKLLRANRIPYLLSGGMSFFERTEIKDLMAYLKLMINPDDDNAFLRVINTPRREIGSITLEKLGNYAQERSISLLTACFEYGLTQVLSEKAVESLQTFANWLVNLSDQAERNVDPIELTRELLNNVNYQQWLKESCSDIKTAEKKMANVEELILWMQELLEREDKNNLKDIVSYLSLLDILDRQAEEKITDRVSLMTLHAAKGLEFPHVFIVGMEEEILPHINNLHEDNLLQEERRLAYVGITRARKTLTFSLAEKRKKYGEQQHCQPSRFLQELPQDIVIWENPQTALDFKSRQIKARNHLDSIKAFLKG
jgi:ATP-dependent DNA helicase Rep